MNQTLVCIDCGLIHDWGSFHDVFARALGFPAYYGRNLDAWIDVMGDPGQRSGGGQDTLLVLRLDQTGLLRGHAPEIWTALLDCAAFVNQRRLEAGAPACLVLAY